MNSTPSRPIVNNHVVDYLPKIKCLIDFYLIFVKTMEKIPTIFFYNIKIAYYYNICVYIYIDIVFFFKVICKMIEYFKSKLTISMGIDCPTYHKYKSEHGGHSLE